MRNRHLVFLAVFSIAMCGLSAAANRVHAQQPTLRQVSSQLSALGDLATGAKVVAVQSPSKEWGIEIESPGLASVRQLQPVRLELYEGEAKITESAAGYKSIKKTTDGFVGQAEITPLKGVVFRVEDRWTVSGPVLTVARKVAVSGSAPGGFFSAVVLSTDKNFSFPDVSYFIPGASYGGPEHLLEVAPAGMANYRAGRIEMREDKLAVPVLGMYFRDGTSVAVLNPRPRGDTTAAESQDREGRTMIDERFQFAALGVRERTGGGLEMGYWFPGTESRMQLEQYGGPVRRWRRRYHPIRDGFSQQYEVAFRFGRDESFHGFYSNTWRWAWATLKPAVNYQDIELVRQSLVDQLASTVITHDGRTGVPFACDTISGKLGAYFRDSNSVMGFVGKSLESAAWLLADADRDPTPRGEKHRQLGLAVFDSFVRIVNLSPPAGEGFNIFTGQVTPTLTVDWGPLGNKIYLRCLTEDLKMMLKAYRRERGQGRDHPEWLRWCWEFGDWLLRQQRADGGFPRTWKPGTGEVFDSFPTSSYAPVAFLVLLSQETGQQRYMEAALRAGEFCWLTYHSMDQFVGGTPDNPNVMDKEAGTLSLEAYLALFEATKVPKWLQRAAAAGDYAETWIYGWNVPMPEDEDNSKLHWKKGVSTVGVNKINSTGDGVDQWMAVDVHEYAKLYAYTKDSHYLDVARILLHNTKNMLALPGRTFDMVGPGWQQEHWSMSMRRGFGAHRSWLPWVTANHLTGIFGLEDFDPALFKKLASKNETQQ